MATPSTDRIGDKDESPSVPRVTGGARSQGRRLFLATLVSVLLVCTAILFVQAAFERQYSNSISNYLSTTLKDAVASVRLWHLERKNDALIWASHIDVVSNAKELLSLPHSQKSLAFSPAQKKLRSLFSPVLEKRGYLGFFIISSDLINLASTRDENIGIPSLLASQRKFIDKVLSGSTAVSLPQFSEVPLPDESGKLVKGRPTMFVGAPIEDDTGEVVAILAFRIDPNKVFYEIIQRGRRGETGETYAFNTDGMLLNHSRFESQLREIGLIGEDQDSVLKVHIRDHGGNLTQGYKPKPDPSLQPLTKMADSAISGRSGIDINGYRDYRGVIVVGAWQWMGNLGFGLATEQDKEEAYAPLTRFRYLAAGSTLFIVLLVLGLANILHRGNRRTAESAERYRAVFDHVVDGLITIDEQGTVESINPAAEKIFGYGLEEVIGKNVKMLMPAHYATQHDGYITNYLKTGEAKIIGFERELEARRKNGEIFPIDLGVSEVRLPNKRLFLGVIRDITERKEAELELQELTNGLANAQSLAHVGSWRRYLNKDHQAWSDEFFRIIGHEPQAFPARYEAYLEHVHPDDVRVMQRAIEESENQGSQYKIEHRIVRPDGTVRHVLEEGGLTRDENGEPEYLSGIIQDITERKKVDVMKSEFVSTVSHELRTPLTSIHGSLGLLVGGAAGEVSDQAKSLLDIAHKSSDRLIRLINDILDVEKLEANRMTFNMQFHDVVELVEKSLAANTAYAEQFDIKINLESKVEKAEVLADADRFEQIMANLLSNAAKFSPQGGQVELTVERRKGDIFVSVSDQGPGIPDDFKNKIFQKFAQADSSDTRKISGTGLGLRIFKQLVERMGGEVGFETEQGVGTTFHFSLPELGRDKPEIQMQDAPSSIPRVLICEDDPDVANLLRLMLAKDGLSCDIAYNAGEAKRMLMERSYSSMTLDLILPDMDGLTLLRELRSDEKTKKLPVIVVSAKADEGREELNGDAFGIIDWLSKPLDPDHLHSAVGLALSQNRSERPKILHVEDDPDIVTIVTEMLRGVAEVVGAPTLADAKRHVGQESYDLVILDIELPDGSGVQLLPYLNRDKGESTPVLVFSAGDISKDISQKVSAALVKSKTANETLVDTIRALMPNRKPTDVSAE